MTGENNNQDLDLSTDVRPQTAPLTGKAGADWPESNKNELISRMSQQMRAKVNVDPLIKQYKQKKNLTKAMKTANEESKSAMNEVRLLFNA